MDAQLRRGGDPIDRVGRVQFFADRHALELRLEASS
jgi:hypothetical protein